MKKALYISGIITVLLLALLLSGWASADDAVKEAMHKGNQYFESADYSNALIEYETGLSANSGNKQLNFNAAQAAYLIGEYDKAIEYFGKSEDTVEKFLTAGNICYRAGDYVEDINEKVQFYAQALQLYKEGIIKYPQDVSLKYNYELVKEKLEELLEDMEQESQEQGEEGEEGNSQESQEQESSDGEDSQGGQEQESEVSEEQQGNQEQDSEDSEDQQGGQEQDSEQNEEAEDSQSQSQSQSQDGEDGQEESYSQNEEENAADQEAVERILQMLESQEEQSLKNNQEVVGGNEGKNGW